MLLAVQPKSVFEKVRRSIERPIRMTHVMWLQLTGRRYYFRDQPTWFVVWFACLVSDDNCHDDELLMIVREARDEMFLRIDRVRRQLERAALEGNLT
jgi:hypothetical protein